MYSNMSKEEINNAYNNTKAVDNFAELLRDFQDRSIKVYKKYSWVRDLHYGSKSRERFDFLSCGDNHAPTYIFIHGGYWTNCTKEDFSFISEGPMTN